MKKRGRVVQQHPANEVAKAPDRTGAGPRYANFLSSAPAPSFVEPATAQAMQKSLRDLHLYRLELEMQNEQLRRAHDELSAERTRYLDLYDLAPLGYCTVDEDGVIQQANLTLADLLGLTRRDLVDQRISRFIFNDDQDVYYLFCKQIVKSDEPQSCELRMVKAWGAPFWAQLAATAVKDGSGVQTWRIVLSNITKQKQIEAELRDSQKRYRTLIEWTREAIAVHRNGLLVFVNPATIKLFGADSAQDLIGRQILDFVHPDFRQIVLARVAAASATDVTTPMIEEKFLKLDGTVIDVEVQSTWVSYHGEPAIQVALRDITERKKIEEKLQLAASVFSHAREGIMITSADGAIIEINDTFTQITGFGRVDVLGQNPRLLRSGHHETEFYAAIWRDLVELGHWSGEIWNRRKTGEVYAVMQTISGVRDAQGKVRHYVALFSDITSIKERESELEHIANCDGLTGLPNRGMLADRLQHAMAQTQRRGQMLAVVYLDLDGFKGVNDSHGHEAGDLLLIALSIRMKELLRDGDTLARLGGDEFVAVLMDLADVQASVPTLQRLLSAVVQPVLVGDLVLNVSASLGVTFFPQPGDVTANQLLQQADQAMYQAKLAGKNCYQVFNT